MITYKTLKSKSIKYSGRSSDYLFPTISQGCIGACIYCYAARHSEEFRNKIMISTNIDEIINVVKNHDCKDIIKPNQTHDKYITWDIGCNSDVSVDINYIDWIKLFNYFKYSERDLATFATKFVNPKLLTYNPDRKIRVRLSLMPENISNILEPKTSSIPNRIEFINHLYNAGYEVHLNFSPVVYFKDWQEHYKNLFIQIDNSISKEVKDQLKCEVIFLTHNEKLHERNVKNNIPGENLIWNPEIQESKISSFGGKNIRYKSFPIKTILIGQFKKMLNEYLPYCEIRYIF